LSNSATATPERLDEVALHLVFQLIAGAYASPSAALRGDLGSGAFGDALDALADGLGLAAPDVTNVAWASLQTAYVRLFVTSASGITAPPYVGLAIDDTLMGPSAQLLGSAFAEHGIELRDGWRDLPDHVAAVAEGGALLVQTGRGPAAAELLEHFVAPWFERFGAAIATDDASGFYGPLTRFLQAAIKEVLRETRP
jgi:TorA maturation chaperone TorD